MIRTIFVLFILLPVVLPQGQVPLSPGLQQRRNRIANNLGGVYSSNVTLQLMNSPYRVTSDLTVEVGATITIETGVQLYFDTGVGMKVKGAIRAIGNEFAHIEFLPYQEMLVYDDSQPDFRLIDGKSVRDGRLQVRFRDRWRSVCTQLTNWTSIDIGTACRSMGHSDGGFWKWYRRNNDTYPAVMPNPDCHPGAKNLWECPGLANPDNIPLSENLCQGEDDIGILCWGQPTFTGWAKHWKGLQIFNSPFGYVPSDPDMVAVNKESRSRLEYVDILYAGYDGTTKNVTSALWIEGVPPIMNGLRIEHSAKDGLYLQEPSGPILIANSTFSFNRGHGVVVENTTDGRLFLNMSRVEHNFGDGIWYSQKTGGGVQIEMLERYRTRRQLDGLYDAESPRADMCQVHTVPKNLFFPHLIRAFLRNGTVIEPGMPANCWITISLPPRLPYTYSLQFVHVKNRNPSTSTTQLVVCDSNDDQTSCAIERFRIPIENGKYPQSLSIKSSGRPIFLSLDHQLEGGVGGYVAGDIDVHFRVHASVMDKAYYGLNITHSIINNNMGNGVLAVDIRERTALSNVTLNDNQGQAGFLVRSGAADIWLNETRIERNWGDGMNVTFSGGGVTVNGTVIRNNRWRGAAFHYNDSSPFIALHQEIIFKGRPSNNIFYMPTFISGNLWGGILVGNFCIPSVRRIEPKVLINWVELTRNHYHPAIEVHSCQGGGVGRTVVDVTGNRIEGNDGMGLRIAPAVNIYALISSNQFLNNNDTTLFIRNADHPQLRHLPADVTISKNSFKFNRAKYIITIGLNEDANDQKLIFNQQNEVRENIVHNPFPHLKPRTTPYAALVVSSSNVVIHRNCFKNPLSEFEIGTELAEHAKWIDARENNWGTPSIPAFMRKIFDQFNRYSLASVEVDPFAAVCNQRNPHITRVQEYFREFKRDNQPYVLGGTVFENHDLAPGRYTVTDDLHIIPGAKLTIAQGSTLEFEDGVGMLVQGELLLTTEYHSDYSANKKVLFTSTPFHFAPSDTVRLVDDDGNDKVTEGRLEVLIDDEWGTVCNRSWTAQHALMACNQMGLVLDPEFFENWRIFPDPGPLDMRMDNIRCEENEVDITKCRIDGPTHNVKASCRLSEVVGIRCAEPRWAGVRYSLLANPPTVTGQTTMNNWIIEKAGLFDFRKPEFSAALQIDWNYHTFHNIEIRDNFWNGLDIVYNDLTKKPAIRNSVIRNNRRNGLRLRSNGITVENITIEKSGQAGIRYDPKVSAGLQRDISSWLDRREQPEMEANNVFVIPNHTITHLAVMESQLNQRKFLLAQPTVDCPLVLLEPCAYELNLDASGYEYGLTSKMAIQIVHPAGNESDEDAVLIDSSLGREYSVRRDQIHFPIVSRSSRMKLRYTRSYGPPKMILLVLFLDSQEYLDRFVHVYKSRIQDNQYGVSAHHYSNLTFEDGTLANRWAVEKLWFQKVNFTRNSEAVIWINSPQHEVKPNTPIAQIGYHLDNCSIHDNTGAVIETHRDLFASANVFHWNIWSNTFENNTNSGIAVRLPDTYDLLAKQQHLFLMAENRFQNNDDFRVLLDGYYCFANISSNNFTDNFARRNFGILEISGMEKDLIVERNRFFTNWGNWMVKLNMQSQTIRNSSVHIPAYIQYNYIQHNHFIKKSEDYVDMWPRSYAVGIFGTQKADVHFNRLKNVLMDFELVAGCRPLHIGDSMNATHNWWGTGNDAEVAQRVFDMDDWNIYTLANVSPFYTTEEIFMEFWWRPRNGQLATASHIEPSVDDLKGRMYKSKTMLLDMDKWDQSFPSYYKPRRPYRITKDLTIMPGATLTIQKGVEVHVWPNVRILVLGDLVAEGTYWEPIRIKPLNMTEYDEIRGKIGTRYRRNSSFRLRRKRSDVDMRVAQWARKKRANRGRPDKVYSEFPSLFREDPYYQTFDVSLSLNGSRVHRSGFLQIHNATTGEIIPSCDRQFTVRNAQVVCRQMGYPTLNAYHWVTPRWEYNPKIRILKTYMEPRECRGDEERFDRCPLRLSGNTSLWQCMDNEHFNYIYCGESRAVNRKYLGSWGGISFARMSAEIGNPNESEEGSVLRHVEIVGGGLGHNDTYQGGSLLVFHRSPIMDHVNVTNSSMHGIEIISPRDKVILNRVNVTDNHGRGVSIVTINLQVTQGNQEVPNAPLSIPYFTQGMVDMCGSGKRMNIDGRVMLYYKYDSRPVDCVKTFESKGKKVSFRFLQVNFYSSPTDLGRSDALRIYSSENYHPSTLLADFRASTESYSAVTTPLSVSISASSLSLHLRATAADGEYGFIAEVTSLPSLPDTHAVNEVVIVGSRLDNNDRGALNYANSGEISPSVTIDDCSLSNNGIHLYGNVSTSMQAAYFTLHNTQMFMFRGNSLVHNRGGLLVVARSSAAATHLGAVVKNNLFTANTNSTTLAFIGNNYQKVTMINNIISYNYALYHDTVLVKEMSLNMTNNLYNNNTGLHTIDLHGYSRVSTESTFLKNTFTNNLALGHGHQYLEKFGYQPTNARDDWDRERPRQKRQVISQEGVSYDWWTHVGEETERYRSTILAGSSRQTYHLNVFSNPMNDYELSTVRQSSFDSGAINASENYWGYPGTEGVAAGKIRDQSDYPYLIRVNYHPVLESNTSLVEGDCPAGWIQAGRNEFKSCYLFVGAAATFTRATEYCEEMDAFLPYLTADDNRQKELALRIDEMNRAFMTDQERFSAFGGLPLDTPIWISSTSIPSTHCAGMSARTGRIEMFNCGNLFPFICQKGTGSYHEPAMWRTGVIIGVIIAALLLTLIFLLMLCWCIKSRRRTEEIIERKNIIRASMKLQKKHTPQYESAYGPGPTHQSAVASLEGSSILSGFQDPFTAHRNMMRGNVKGASSKSPTDTERTSCSGSLHTDHTYETTTGYGRTGTSGQTTRPSDYSLSEGYYSEKAPRKNKVSTAPNPYSEISTQCSTFGKVKLRPHSVHDTSCSSATTPTSGAASCSTCPTDRDSTVTDGSWSEHSSQMSDSTLQQKPLVPQRDRTTTLQSFSIAGTQRRDDVDRQPRASTRHFDGPPSASRSNPSIYAPLPVHPPRIPLATDRQAPLPPGQGASSRSRPADYPPPPAPARAPVPARSLVDLYNPNYHPPQRNDGNFYSSRKPLVETSM